MVQPRTQPDRGADTYQRSRRTPPPIFPLVWLSPHLMNPTAWLAHLSTCIAAFPGVLPLVWLPPLRAYTPSQYVLFGFGCPDCLPLLCFQYVRFGRMLLGTID